MAHTLAYKQGKETTRTHTHTHTQHTHTVAEQAFSYWFYDDISYAKVGVRLARVFFLYNNTRMNPNFQFAQALPGV